jgi:hypothetical protein
MCLKQTPSLKQIPIKQDTRAYRASKSTRAEPSVEFSKFAAANFRIYSIARAMLYERMEFYENSIVNVWG